MSNKPTYEELEKQVVELKEKLKHQQSRYDFINKSILDTIPCPIFFKDKNGIYQDCNKAFAEIIFGEPKEYFIGKSLKDFSETLPENLRIKYANSDKRVLETGESTFYDAKVPCPDGLIRHFSFFKSPIKNSKNEVKAIVALMIDITDRVNKELALRETEKRFQLLQEASFGGLVIHDMGKILDLNEKACKIIGYPRSSLIGLDALQLVTPEGIDKSKQRLISK
jgi:PAS domain S-box-containing protein